MDHEQVIRSLKRQLLIERIATGAVALIVLTIWIHGHFSNTKSLILVDGKPVVCVTSEKDANAVLSQIKTQAGNPSDVQFRQDVCVARAPRDAEPVSRHRAMRLVRGVVSPVVPKWSIIIDGQPAVAVPSRETAGEALNLAKLKFGKLAKNLSEEPQFKENVRVDIATVDPSIYCKTAEEAVKALFSASVPAPKDAVYIVEKGDIAANIASRHGIKLDTLFAMNPGVDLVHLQIGDKIRIKSAGIPKQKLTVVVRDQTEATETIPAPVQRVSSVQLAAGKELVISPGSAGQRKVKAAVIYENGHRVGSEVLDEQILREPTPKRIAVGIRSR